MQEALRAQDVENAEPGTLDRHGRCPPGSNGGVDSSSDVKPLSRIVYPMNFAHFAES